MNAIYPSLPFFFTQLFLHKAPSAAVVQCPAAASVRSKSEQMHPLWHLLLLWLYLAVTGCHATGC